MDPEQHENGPVVVVDATVVSAEFSPSASTFASSFESDSVPQIEAQDDEGDYLRGKAILSIIRNSMAQW